MDFCRSLEELFEMIEGITGVRDIGYHEIREGRLFPVHKTNTDVLGITKWKDAHARNPVHIKGTTVLEELLQTGEPVIVADVKNDVRSADAFFLFGIDSIMIVPVKANGITKGVICIACIGKLHDFTDDEILECSSIVRDCFKDRIFHEEMN